MKVYFSFMLNTFQSALAYRANIVCELISCMISIVIEVCLWKALYNNSEYVVTSVGNVGLQEMITYAVVSTLMSLVITNSVVNKLNDKVSSGQIAMDIIKPIKMRIYMFFEMLGQIAYDCIVKMIPLLICIWIFLGPIRIANGMLIYFVIAIVNAIILNYLITYILGLCAFWYIQAWQIGYVYQYIMILLSGSWIPLWFFPEILRNLIGFLPFNLIYYVPLSIFLGKYTYTECYKFIGIQLLWIVICIIVERFMWQRALRKLVIQGG